MPARFVIRDFVKDGYYHIYNSSHEGQLLFREEADYTLFLYYLSVYLSPIEKLLKKHPDVPVRLYHKNLSRELTLFAYSLQPDHFHLLIKQDTPTAVPLFMKQLANAYMQYVTTKYRQRGSLFQGRYKAARIIDPKQLVPLSRHLHYEPVLEKLGSLEYPWSSYQEYTGLSTRNLCEIKTILSFFPSVYAYKKYHQDTKGYQKSLEKISPILIE